MKILLYIFYFWIQCTASFGQLDATFSQGKLKPSPIAILKFNGEHHLDNRFTDVIANNLHRSGFFDIIPSESFVEKNLRMDETPCFQDWKLIKARLLLTGNLSVTDNTLIIKFHLWDIYSQKQMARGTIKAKKKYWRRLAHIVSDLIYKRVTGNDGYFDSRIVYIAETGPQQKRTRRLALMDQDGENHKYLTEEGISVITPRFSPSEQKIAYMQYEPKSKLGKIYILDLETGRKQTVQDIPGITYAPRFSPDGSLLAFSQADKGRSSLYLFDLKSKKNTPLPRVNSIDTSPSFSPDGQKIVFNSDRGNKKQLYIIDLKTMDTKRISFGGGLYATPNWSPDGKWIAFTKKQDGQFYIGLMQPDGTHERLIATGYLVEGPSWASNSHTLCFYKQEPWDKTGTAGGRAKIYTIDISGANQQEVPTPMDGTDPSWSPPLPFEQMPSIDSKDFENDDTLGNHTLVS